jgi:hypothetical protein
LHLGKAATNMVSKPKKRQKEKKAGWRTVIYVSITSISRSNHKIRSRHERAKSQYRKLQEYSIKGSASD